MANEVTSKPKTYAPKLEANVYNRQNSAGAEVFLTTPTVGLTAPSFGLVSFDGKLMLDKITKNKPQDVKISIYPKFGSKENTTDEAYSPLQIYIPSGSGFPEFTNKESDKPIKFEAQKQQLTCIETVNGEKFEYEQHTVDFDGDGKWDAVINQELAKVAGAKK